MRNTADVHGVCPLITCPGVAGVPNGRYGPVTVVAVGSVDSTSLLAKLAPFSVMSAHGISWNSGCILTQKSSGPTTPLLVALPSPQYSLSSGPKTMWSLA